MTEASEQPNEIANAAVQPQRCSWALGSQLYMDYHDHEWGVPVHDDRKLFEMLILEGAQAGLSWATILQKRQGYRLAFDNFDPALVARYDEQKVAALLNDTTIVRNRLKINAALENARAFLRIQEHAGSFESWLWQFVQGQPLQQQWSSLSEVPASTPLSDTLSKALKKAGFRFVGSTICYSFMQAVGLVNDHLTSCFRWSELHPKP